MSDTLYFNHFFNSYFTCVRYRVLHVLLRAFNIACCTYVCAGSIFRAAAHMFACVQYCVLNVCLRVSILRAAAHMFACVQCRVLHICLRVFNIACCTYVCRSVIIIILPSLVVSNMLTRTISSLFT